MLLEELEENCNIQKNRAEPRVWRQFPRISCCTKSPAPAELSLAVKECKCWLEDRGQRGGSVTQPAAVRGYGPTVSG